MTAVAGRPLHVVQVGWDTALLEARAASDSRERQSRYAALLAARRPGSRMTIVVLGAPAGSRGFDAGNLKVLPVAGRWTGLARLPRLLRSLQTETPIDVIAAQSPLEDGIATLAFARGRIPVVAQVHFDLLADASLPDGPSWRTALGTIRRRTALALLPRYAMVRVVAERMRDPLIALGAREVRVAPVPIFDLDTLRMSDAQLEPPPHVLFVGRLAPEKNLDLWLDVARRVHDAVPGAQFDIVGDGALRGRLEIRARESGLGQAITFHGGKTRAELPSLFARASVFLLTSDHEGFGRVLVEALAAGLPVVSTRTSGALEVIGDSPAGILAEVGDGEGLAAGVVQLLTDDRRRTEAIAAAPAVVGRYDPLSLAGAWVDMLIEAADRHPRT